MVWIAVGILIGLPLVRLAANYLQWRKLPRPTPARNEIVAKFAANRRRVIGPQRSPISGEIVGWVLIDDWGYSQTEFHPLPGYRVLGQATDIDTETEG